MRTDSKGNVVKHNSYEEWQKKNAAKKLAAALATEEGRNELKALYESLDGDGDGKLNAEEWSTGLAANAKIVGKYFGGVSADETAETFSKIDKDGSGELSWEEFLDGAAT